MLSDAKTAATNGAKAWIERLAGSTQQVTRLAAKPNGPVAEEPDRSELTPGNHVLWRAQRLATMETEEEEVRTIALQIIQKRGGR